MPLARHYVTTRDSDDTARSAGTERGLPPREAGSRRAMTTERRRMSDEVEITRIPNRGHSLTIDSGWREVAQTALDFVKRFV